MSNLNLHDLPSPEELRSPSRSLSVHDLPSPDDLKSGDDSGISSAESLLRGLGQGATVNFGDEASGALEAAMGLGQSALTGSNAYGDEGHLAGLQNLLDNYRRSRDTHRSQNDAAAKAHSGYYLGGELAGGLLPAIATGGASGEIGAIGEGSNAINSALKGGETGVRAAMSLGGKLGAATALGGSRADLTQGDFAGAASDTAKGALMGLATGGAGELAVEGLGSAKDALARKFAQEANVSRVAALGGGKRAMKKLLSRDKIQEMGEQLKDDIHWNTSRPEIEQNLASKLGEQGEQIGSMISSADSYAGGATGVVPAEQIAERMRQEVLTPLMARSSTRRAANQINQFIEDFEQQHEGTYLTLDELQKFKNDIANETGVFERANDKALTGGYKDLYRVFNTSAEQGLEQAEGKVPGVSLESFKNVKKGYGNTTQALDMVRDRNARDATNRMFSPSDYFSGGTAAVGAAIAHPGALIPIAAGVAAAGANKVARSYGNQMAASGYDLLSSILSSNPSALGRFAGPLQEAAGRSQNALISTDFVMSQIFPDYQQKKDELSSQVRE